MKKVKIGREQIQRQVHPRSLYVVLEDGRAAVLSYTSWGKLNAKINSKELTVQVLENRVDLKRELSLVEEEKQGLSLKQLKLKTVGELLCWESEQERIKAELAYLEKRMELFLIKEPTKQKERSTSVTG